MYVNFTATLEKFGTACTVKLKGGADSDTLPYAITKNGIYTFVVTGTYGEGIIITKEIEVKVNKYQAAKNLVKYDAGDWTEDEINTLKEKSLYNINIAKKASADTGLNFTFGGFTYAKDSTGNVNTIYVNEIKSGTVITSRNQSVAPGSGYGTPAYDGWQILEIQDSTGNIIKNENEISNKLDNLSSVEKIYVTKLVHAGSPENFVSCSYANNEKDKYNAYKEEYILSGGQRQTNYNTYQARDWSMYKDKKQLNLIDEVRIMTYEDALEITGSKATTVGIRRTNSLYCLGTAANMYFMLRIETDGRITESGSYDEYCWGIRPVVSMKEGVYIASGDGTEADPYVLSKD